ncbi:MAG: M16 family metallopeptidase, partial [Pyrinomonadaceae bacterium]
FPAKELELLKQNRKQGLIAQRGQPAFLARERVAKVLYGDHPYSIVSATPASIEAMTIEKLSSFYKSSFLPNNAVMIVVGDINRDTILKQITSLFGKWQKGQSINASTERPTPPARSAREIYLVDRPGSAQSNIVIGNIAINRSHPDYYAVQVLNTVLGANPSSRLFMNLREAKSYTYGANSSFDSRREAGIFSANSEVRTPVTGAALKEFFYEFDRIRNEPVSDKEIKDAKSFITGVFPLQLETVDGLIAQLLSIKMYGLPVDYLQTYRDKINAISKEDIQRVARQYISPDKIAIVIVGDAAIISQEIKPYAEKISLFDISGSPKTDVTPASNNAVGATPANTTSGSAESVLGAWKVDISGAGQPMTAKLTITKEGDKFAGTVESDLGTGQIVDLSVNGNSFDGTIKFQMQGQDIQGKMGGKTDAGKLNGTIDIPNLPQFLFSGERSNQR